MTDCDLAPELVTGIAVGRWLMVSEKVLRMRALTGAILILAGEQAFSHAFLIAFPHQAYARTILLPLAAVAMTMGLVLLVLGLLRDGKPS